MKTYLTVGVIVLAIAAAGAWYKSRIDAAELRGRVEALLADLERTRAAYSQDSAHWAAEDSAKAAEIRELQNVQAELEANLVTTRQQARAQLTDARQMIDSLRVAGVDLGDIPAAIDSLEAEADVCSLALANCGSITRQLEERVGGLIKQNVEAGALIAQQDRTIGALQEIEPSKPILPWAIAGASAGLLILSLIFG